MTRSAIGSVLPFPLAEVGGPEAESIWATWTGPFRRHAAFGSARAALHALLRHEGVRRLWLPAYICAETASAAPDGCEVAYYDGGPTGPVAGLHPIDGDAVLGVDYFGRTAATDLRAMARTTPGVLWIEDRAQALAPGTSAWGDVVLYSPRKLIGVPDGGLLVADRPLPPSSEPVSDPSAWSAALARFDDPDGRRPQRWGPAFRAREAAFSPKSDGMQLLTRELLRRIAIPPLIARRKANYAHLLALLPEFALWPEAPADFAALAFPVRVAAAAEVVAAMAAARIFCARHWAELPSPLAAFPDAHALAAQAVSLPCDHRYDGDDMLRIAAALRACAGPI